MNNCSKCSSVSMSLPKNVQPDTKTKYFMKLSLTWCELTVTEQNDPPGQAD